MDLIHKPKHYCFSKYEPKDVIREWGLNFNLGSAVKYIARAGRKDDIIQDLEKAREFLTFEIEALEDEREQREQRKQYPEHINCKCRSEESAVDPKAELIIKLSDIVSMKASEFREKYERWVEHLGRKCFVGASGDRWGLIQILDDRGSTLDVPHFPNTVRLRFERLKSPDSDVSANEMDVVLRD